MYLTPLSRRFGCGCCERMRVVKPASTAVDETAHLVGEAPVEREVTAPSLSDEQFSRPTQDLESAFGHKAP